MRLLPRGTGLNRTDKISISLQVILTACFRNTALNSFESGAGEVLGKGNESY